MAIPWQVVQWAQTILCLQSLARRGLGRLPTEMIFVLKGLHQTTFFSLPNPVKWQEVCFAKTALVTAVRWAHPMLRLQSLAWRRNGKDKVTTETPRHGRWDWGEYYMARPCLNSWISHKNRGLRKKQNKFLVSYWPGDKNKSKCFYTFTLGDIW